MVSTSVRRIVFSQWWDLVLHNHRLIYHRRKTDSSGCRVVQPPLLEPNLLAELIRRMRLDQSARLVDRCRGGPRVISIVEGSLASRGRPDSNRVARICHVSLGTY